MRISLSLHPHRSFFRSPAFAAFDCLRLLYFLGSLPGMIADIRQLLNARPFEPFLIVTSGGNRYRVAGAEHAGIDPQRSRVVVWFDDGSSVTITGLHIASIEKEAKQNA
jgi:hypothetical protein